MTNIIHPEKDAPLERMDIHKDIVWVIRTLWGGAIVIIAAAMWVAALASDVDQNKEKLKDTVSTETAASIVASLERIENKIDAGDERQRAIQQDLAALKQKVNDIEEEVESQ